MRLLIDGYNLMFQVITLDPRLGPKALQSARRRFLMDLIKQIDAPMRPATTIVFDSSDAPKGLQDSMIERGVQIQFARDWASADEMIQSIIRKHSTPKRLTVVSSDHSIQKTASARGARAVDCHDWLDELAHEFAHRSKANVTTIDDQTEPLNSANDLKNKTLDPAETQQWLREFGE